MVGSYLVLPRPTTGVFSHPSFCYPVLPQPSSASTGCFTQLLLPHSSASYTGLPAYLSVHQRTSCILPHHTSFRACAPPRRSSVLISLGRTFRLWLSTYIIQCEALLPSEPANQRISDPVTRSSVATHEGTLGQQH